MNSLSKSKLLYYSLYSSAVIPKGFTKVTKFDCLHTFYSFPKFASQQACLASPLEFFLLQSTTIITFNNMWSFTNMLAMPLMFMCVIPTMVLYPVIAAVLIPLVVTTTAAHYVKESSPIANAYNLRVAQIAVYVIAVSCFLTNFQLVEATMTPIATVSLPQPRSTSSVRTTYVPSPTENMANPVPMTMLPMLSFISTMGAFPNECYKRLVSIWSFILGVFCRLWGGTPPDTKKPQSARRQIRSQSKSPLKAMPVPFDICCPWENAPFAVQPSPTSTPQWMRQQDQPCSTLPQSTADVSLPTLGFLSPPTIDSVAPILITLTMLTPPNGFTPGSTPSSIQQFLAERPDVIIVCGTAVIITMTCIFMWLVWQTRCTVLALQQENADLIRRLTTDNADLEARVNDTIAGLQTTINQMTENHSNLEKKVDKVNDAVIKVTNDLVELDNLVRDPQWRFNRLLNNNVGEIMRDVKHVKDLLKECRCHCIEARASDTTNTSHEPTRKRSQMHDSNKRATDHEASTKLVGHQQHQGDNPAAIKPTKSSTTEGEFTTIGGTDVFVKRKRRKQPKYKVSDIYPEGPPENPVEGSSADSDSRRRLRPRPLSLTPPTRRHGDN